jgi:hypothetical protein
MSKQPLILILAGVVALCITAFNMENRERESTDPEEILTSTTWQIEELRFLQNNTPYYYKQGVTGNVAGLDHESITFNSDHTGIYIAGENKFRLQWEFVDEEKTELQYVLEEATPLLITWENLKLDGNRLEYTEYYNREGLESLARGKRVSTKNDETITFRKGL